MVEATIVPDWIELPKHLWDLILEKLESPSDYLQFSVVCRSCYSLTKDNQNKLGKKLELRQVPILLIPIEKEHIWRIYNVMKNSFLEKYMWVPHDKRFSGSSEGWLVTVEVDYTVKLYKPNFMNSERKSKSNRIVHLPRLFPPAWPLEADDIEWRGIHILSTTIVEADPTRNPDDFVVVVRYGEFLQLAFIRPFKDTTWIHVDVGERITFADVVYYKNKFYAINYLGKIISFDVTNSSNLNIKLITSERSSTGFYGRRYLVKSQEHELLIVERYSQRDDTSVDRKVLQFKLFKLDLDQAKWIETKSLGNTTLFIGDNSAISVISSNFDGCQPNSIYFTHDEDTAEYGPHGPCDLGVYNLDSQGYVWHYNIELDVIGTMNGRPPIWLIPPITY
ncbi:hypothetical protein UlMin_024502 [Ulmus minor]